MVGLGMIGTQAANAFTHTCEYGPPPPNPPPGTTNPTLYSRLDWTTAENPTANGLRMFSSALDPNSTLIGYLESYVPLPQTTPSWLAHVLVLGSPFQVGVYSIGSHASAFVLIFFEGRYWPVDIGYLSSCNTSGHIP